MFGRSGPCIGRLIDYRPITVLHLERISEHGVCWFSPCPEQNHSFIATNKEVLPGSDDHTDCGPDMMVEDLCPGQPGDKSHGKSWPSNV